MRMNNKLILRLCVFWFTFFSGRLFAHEFWLEPINFTPAINDNIVAHLKVGQNFKGNPLAFMTVDFEDFEITLGDKNNTSPPVEVNTRFGNIPAVDQANLGQGLTLLSYVSGNSTVVYSSYEQFTEFLQKEGLSWVLTEHHKRNLPKSGFTEAYQRFSKSLIAVANGNGKDYALGLRFEWVLKDNPYLPTITPPQTIEAQLLWEGKPFPNSQAIVFSQRNGTVAQQLYTTDNKGEITLPQQPDTTYMISAVHMIKPGLALAGSTGAVWKSLWSSTTFKTPAN